MDLSHPSKRLIIRKFKPRHTSYGSSFEGKWQIMEDSVQNIQEEQKAAVSFEELYRIVENLCLNGCSGEMYTRLLALIRRYIEMEAQRLCTRTQELDSQGFLLALNTSWGKFCAQMGMIRSIFLFLDRTYRTQNTSAISLWDSGLEAFRCHFFTNTTIQSNTLKGILGMIESERLGVPVNRQLLKSLIRMLMNLQIYDELFELEFLHETQRLYEAEGRAKCQELETDAYLWHIVGRIREEEERIDYYLEFSTAKKLMAVVDHCLIGSHVDSIISKGAELLFRAGKIDELTLMHKLLTRVKGGLVALKNAFQEYITKYGRAMVTDPQRDPTLVQELLEFKSRLDDVLQQCFNNDEKFIQAEKDAFAYFINTRPQKPAELIARYIDSKLRKGNKELSEEELDSLMDKVIVLFRFVQGKDVFEAYYKRSLAKRLLLGRSASYDSEKAMLLKLKTECGAAFTQRLDRMFQDIEVSKTLMERFNERFSRRKDKLGIFDFSVMALSKCFWPFEEMLDFEIPAALQTAFRQYTQFYSEIYSGRKLELVLEKSTGEMYCNAFSRKYTFIVSTIQISLLLLFNDCTKYTVEQLAERIRLDVGRVTTSLGPLIKSQLLTLLSSTENGIYQDGSSAISLTGKSLLRLNENFSSKKTKVDLSRVVELRRQEDVEKEENEEVQKALDADRKYAIEAAIVRIMKMRKTLKHQELVREVLAQLAGRCPTVPQIKMCIDRLIDQYYLKRADSDRETYEYQA